MLLARIGDGGGLAFKLIQQVGEGFIAHAAGLDVTTKAITTKQQEHGHGNVGQAHQRENPGYGSLGRPIGEQDAVNTGQRRQVQRSQRNGQ